MPSLRCPACLLGVLQHHPSVSDARVLAEKMRPSGHGLTKCPHLTFARFVLYVLASDADARDGSRGLLSRYYASRIAPEQLGALPSACTPPWPDGLAFVRWAMRPNALIRDWWNGYDAIEWFLGLLARDSPEGPFARILALAA